MSLAAPASASTTLLAAGEHSAPVTQLAARLGLSVLLELTFLGGRDRVAPLPVHALLID